MAWSLLVGAEIPDGDSLESFRNALVGVLKEEVPVLVFGTSSYLTSAT